MEPQTPVAPAPAAPAPVTDFVPQQWPGAFGIFKTARQAFSINWAPIVLLMVLTIVASVVFSSFSGGVDGSGDPKSPAMYAISQILNFIFSVLIGGAVTVVMLKSAQGVKESLGNALSVVGSKFLPFLAQNIVLFFMMLFSLLALIVPFFFVLPRIIMAPYFLFDKDMGPIESIKASWAATKGNAGKVWGLIGLSILCALTAILIITIPLTIYLVTVASVATAILYYWIVRYGAAQAAPAAPVAPVAPTAPTEQ